MIDTEAPPEAESPEHAITVTDAGSQCLALRALIRQVIPIIRNPGACSPEDRLDIADSLAQLLGTPSASGIETPER